MAITPWLNGLNILLIFSLLYVYLRTMKRVKSLFSVGLVIFAGLFLVQNLVALYFSLTMMALYAEGVEVFVQIFYALQAVAFGVLNYITWK